MKIGKLAARAQCKIETIRYYEKAGLLPEPQRSEGGYREYSENQLKRLVFIRRSRELGFTIEDIRTLLELVDGKTYSCADVQRIAERHVTDIRRKIADLAKLETNLSTLAAQCSGDSVPECPIIDSLFESAKD